MSADTNEDQHVQAIADAIRPVLQDGDNYHVARVDDQILVSEAYTSICSVKYPRLYGRLLSINAEIEASGGSFASWGLLLMGAVVVGIQLDWFVGVVPQNLLDHTKSVWFYVLAMLLAIQLLGLLGRPLERAAYARNRSDLLSLMATEGVDRDLLVAMLEGDDQVTRVAAFLKLDHEAGSHPRV
jgi:hypothetical protein